MKKSIKFRKYEFNSKEEFETHLALLNDKDGIQVESVGIVPLGHLIETEGTYDENGDEIVPAVYSDKYAVDVFWKIKEHKDWKSFKIKLRGKKSSHTFYGWDYEDEA